MSLASLGLKIGDRALLGGTKVVMKMTMTKTVTE